MSEREQSHGLVLVGGIGVLLALAAIWSQALPDLQAPYLPNPPGAIEVPEPTPGALEAPTPGRIPEASPEAEASPRSEGAPSMLGNTRGRAALELMGPSGAPIKAWVEGKVLDPEGLPLAGAKVWLETSGEEIVARGETRGDGSFSLETTYPPNLISGTTPRKVVARRDYQGGLAQAEQWVRIPGATRDLELRSRIGFDLELRFPFSIRSEVILGGGPGQSRKLPARLASPTRKVPGLAPGELWVAVVGIDPSGGWWAGRAEGRLGGEALTQWEVPLEPLSRLEVKVSNPEGTSSPFKLVVVPLEGNRFRESSLQRHGRGLDFAEGDEEGPDLPEFGVEGTKGKISVSLPPGPWRVSAFGPVGTRPAHAEVKVGAGRAGDQAIGLELGQGLACEFELPAGVSEGELAVHAPAGAYLVDLDEGRWRVAGIGEGDRVEVFLLHSEAASEEEGSEEGGEAPLDEPAPTSCARLRLAPGARERLVMARSATLRVLLPKDDEAGEWSVTIEDSATSAQVYSLHWDLEEDPLTPSGLLDEDDSPREQAWLADTQGAMTFCQFERVVGQRVRSSDVEDDAISVGDLFPGPVRVKTTGPGGLSSTHTLQLVAGETATLDLSR